MLLDASTDIDQRVETEDNILSSPKIKSTTRLLQLTLSDDERQRGLSFLGVIDIASPLCLIQMDKSAAKYIEKEHPGMVPEFLIWNDEKQKVLLGVIKFRNIHSKYNVFFNMCVTSKFAMLSQNKSTKIVELAADVEDFSMFCFDNTGTEKGQIGKWKIELSPPPQEKIVRFAEDVL
mmetsp:Transcript_29668/g.47556  ORF Transcript_29668/g.47556 Transcript_29668/m.47556 type:complete len:177 (+) Transcript_29668:607-1137(+)